MTDRSPFSRFQALLSDIFSFETGDLDFGIYRILFPSAAGSGMP